MADINQEARIPVYINDEQAKSALKNLTNEAEKWRKKMFEAMEGGDLKGLKEAERELKKVNGQMNSIKKEAFDVNKVLQNISSASPKDLKKALAAVNKEMENLNRSSKEYQALMNKKMAIKDEFNKINGVVKEQPGFFSKAANAANKYFNMIAIGIATITGVAFSFGQFVKGMVGLDDSLADVMKTTGLTRKEVRLLYQDFKLLNTRTPRAELLALAEEAGRLGKTGRKDIMAFVEVANKIKIALGDDLGGNAAEAIKEVGKLTEIFRVGQQYGTDFKVSMEKMGSGINEVANNSNASAEYLIEYMKRLGGISTQAKISAADIMGYASTFDQLGQNVEMAATSQSKIIVDMFTDPAKYAKIAKMEVGAFSNLLKTDANEAFIKFLEGLNGNNEGLTVMATKLDSLGIDGARATQALASLSSNTKMLREQQDLANGAMEKGVSLNNEYAIKNNNLAGSWAKLTTFISTKFINSNFLGFLETVIGKLAKMTEVTHPLTKAMNEEVKSVNLLAIELTNTNTPAARRNEIYEELKKIAPDVVANIDAENISLSTLKGNLEQYNQAMIKKLALQDSEETLADKREAAGKATNERIESEIKLREDLYSVMNQAKYWNKDLSKDIEGILLSPDDIITKYNKVNSLLGTIRGSIITSGKSYTKAVVSAREDEKKATDDVTKSLEDYMQRYEMVFGKDKPAPAAPSGGNAPNDGTTPTGNTSSTTDPANATAATDALELAYKQQQFWLKERYEGEETLQKEYNARKLANELAYIMARQALTNDDSTYLDLQNQYIDKSKEYAAAIKEIAPELMKTSEEVYRFNNSLLEESKLLDLAASKQSKGAAELEKYTAKQQMQTEAIQEMTNVMVDYISGALDGTIDEYQTFGDTLILMSLQMLKSMVPIWSAMILGYSLSDPISVATVGVKGMVNYAIVNGLLLAGISAVEGLVKGGIEKRKESSKGYFVGGPTGGSDKRKVAGVVHEEEYVIPEEGYNAPGIRPFVDLIEIARKNGSLARLDLRPVMASVVTGRGYSSGGPVSSSGSTSAQIIVPGSGGMSDATAQKLIKGIDQLVKLKLSIDVKTIKEKMDLLEKYENGGLG